MEKSRADKIIAGYLKKIYGYAVSRTYSTDEAEELSSRIVFEVYRTLVSRDNIVNPDGYIYRVAQSVYARFVADRRSFVAFDGMEYIPDCRDMTEQLISEETAGLLRREITYLSEIRREIIILRYFKDKKISEIAGTLGIPENTVKWHLADSRKELKTGMEKTRTTGTLGVKPIRFTNMGHGGTPGAKGDTADFLAKSLTQNIAYSAYHQPKTVNQIAEELGVNPIFVQDEVAVLEEYGYMDKLTGGKYRTHIHIYIPSKEKDEIYGRIAPKYSKLFAEKFFAPYLDSVKEIPDFLTVPDNDINLLKWAMVCFLSHKLGTAEITGKYSVKRPDGGDFVAFATLEDSRAQSGGFYKYWFCGDMWRNTDFEGDEPEWRSWQFNCYWTDRPYDWRGFDSDEFDKLYYFLKGELPETAANAESYKRLIDKGYLLKKNGGYKCNFIVCKGEDKWRELFPEAPAEVTALAKEYTAGSTKAQLLNQPEFMREEISYYEQNAACSLHTRIMEHLLDMGVLAEPTAEQKKGLLTIMFTG